MEPINGQDHAHITVAGEIKELNGLHETMTMDNIFDVAEQATLEVYKQRDVIRALKYDDLNMRLALLVRNENDVLMFDDEEEYDDWVLRFKEVWSEVNLLLGERKRRIQQYEQDLTNLVPSGDSEFLAKRMMRMIGRLTADDLRQKRMELAQHKELREHVGMILEHDLVSNPTFLELFLTELENTTQAIEKETTRP